MNAPPRTDPVRVLIAEDTATGRDVIRKYLESSNFDLSFVENGREAVSAALRDRFDIILMDVRMPEMDGLEAIRQIRSNEQNRGAGRTPIVVISANTAAEDVRDCVEAGADGHIAKPVARMDVLGAVSEFLSKRD